MKWHLFALLSALKSERRKEGQTIYCNRLKAKTKWRKHMFTASFSVLTRRRIICMTQAVGTLEHRDLKDLKADPPGDRIVLSDECVFV